MSSKNFRLGLRKVFSIIVLLSILLSSLQSTIVYAQDGTTDTPIVDPTETPEVIPTEIPTEIPTDLPTNTPEIDLPTDLPTDTPTIEVTPLDETATETPIFSETGTPTLSETVTPTISITPTLAEVSAMDLSIAGLGTLFRAEITINQKHDYARLKEWNIEILSKSDGSALVQVNREDLEKLARLGFHPTNIDSLEYMVAMVNLTSADEVTSLEVLADSPDLLKAMSSVDTDSDGLTDTEEAWWCTDPRDNNSDSPEEPSITNPSDGDEVDAIIKGITAYGPPFSLWPDFTPGNPSGTCQDGDYDSVPDFAEEFMIGTSNLRESSDLDKFDDGQELFGVTNCPGSSGACGYGILPRAEDAAYVSANLPAWVKAPGNSPFVAAFPEPEVEIIPSSIIITQKTEITNTKGTSTGTEKSYGTSTTKGTSSSIANTETWNSWQEVSDSTSHTLNDASSQDFLGNLANGISNIATQTSIIVGGCVRGISGTENNACNKVTPLVAKGDYVTIAGAATQAAIRTIAGLPDAVQYATDPNRCEKAFTQSGAVTCLFKAIGSKFYNTFDNALEGKSGESSTTLANSSSMAYSSDGTNYSITPLVRISYPQSSITTSHSETTGTSRGGAQTITTSEYQEQTVLESSTNQFSENWSSSTAYDTSHSADLKFTYSIKNYGTEYAREISSLVFNIYIGDNDNPASTYVAVGSTGQIENIENLFPGDSLTFTSEAIPLTFDEMRAIDEGKPIRVVMGDISYGQDQVFYLDAVNGSMTIAVEDGYFDKDETIQTYLIPVWNPSDTLQDVIKRYFPVIEDKFGDIQAIFTPENAQAVPPNCSQDRNIAPASDTLVFCKHGITTTSWWNILLSEGMEYSGDFQAVQASAGSAIVVRMTTDSDLDGYNDREEALIGTNPENPASHPAPVLLSAYHTQCANNNCSVSMVLENTGNYDAYGIMAVMYSPDGLATIGNNTIGGNGIVKSGEKVFIGDDDTFSYTIDSSSAVPPVIILSYNDPQGNHKYLLPQSANIEDLTNDLAFLKDAYLPDPLVNIRSTSREIGSFVVNSPDVETITDGYLIIDYLDGDGNSLAEDTFKQDFASGPSVISVPIDQNKYPSDSTLVLAFFTDSQGNILDSEARPLSTFGQDPLPEANVTVGEWEVGAQSIVDVPNTWDFGVAEPGTTLHTKINLANTGLGDLRYALTGLGNGISLGNSPAGMLAPTEKYGFDVLLDTSGLAPGSYTQTLTLRTSDPNHGSIPIQITGIIIAPGQATAYKVNDLQPWNQYVYVPGPHAQNDVVTFSHLLVDAPSRMVPLYLYSTDTHALNGVGENGVDFDGQTAPFGVFGSGLEGDLVVASGQTIYTDAVKSSISSTLASGSTTVTVNTITGFSIGQEVILIQNRGTGNGNYEFAKVSNLSGNVLTLEKGLTNGYTIDGNSKAQVIRIPQYRNVTIQNGGTLTASAWDGSIGGVLMFRVSGTLIVNSGGQISMTGKGFVGGASVYGAAPGFGQHGRQGEGYNGPAGAQTKSPNGNGGGGGYGNEGGDGGGGGGNAGSGAGGNTRYNTGDGGNGGYASGALVVFGGGGGSGGGEGNSNTSSVSGAGGVGGGAILFGARNTQVSGGIISNGTNGGTGTRTEEGSGGGGGGAGGSIVIQSQDISIGSGNIIATGGGGGSTTGNAAGSGGSGSVGKIRIDYGKIVGTSNPAATVNQVNYFSMTGTNPTNLFVPQAISTGSHIRYILDYGQKSLTNTSGDQLFEITLPNRKYSSFTLATLLTREAGSGNSISYCLDIGNNASCDWTVNNHSFSQPVQLLSTNLQQSLNEYIELTASSDAVIKIPIRVNISTSANIYLFNPIGTVGQDIDLQPRNLLLTPNNGNTPSNTPEGVAVTISARVKNSGTYKAEDFTVGFYLGDPDSGGTLIGSTFIEDLAAGATSPNQTVVWNTTGLIGEKVIYVKVDPSGSIAESDESNNKASANATVKMKPDLTITELKLPDLRAGETGMAQIKVSNLGEADVTGAVINLYNGTQSTGTQIGSTTVNVPAQGTNTAEIQYSIPNVGRYTISGIIDPENIIAEADEANNGSSSLAKIGWDKLVIDNGGANDTSYSSINGYGYLATGSIVNSCGSTPEKTYRQTGSSTNLEYKIDNLLSGRRYHLDLTFAVCSGTRISDIYIDNNKVTDTANTTGIINPVTVNSQLQTVSILLDPAYYSDGSITLSIRRASGLNGPIINIIDLQEITYCYLDSGPDELPWSSINRCGYDSNTPTDGFSGWGEIPYQTARFSDSGVVKYKFTNLDAAKSYNIRTSFYENDGVERDQEILLDGSSVSTVRVNGSLKTIIFPVPPAAIADGYVILTVDRVGQGDALVNLVTLEEDTRTENGRYSAPTIPTPVITPTPPANNTVPQVTLSTFSAVWTANTVVLNWGTTTEINNSSFILFRSLDASLWTEITPHISSTRACGNYTGSSPVQYSFTDSAVTSGKNYYYKIQFSGESCGTGVSSSSIIARANPNGSGYIPAIESLVPSSIMAGSADFSLTINGTNFNSSSVVQWNGEDRPTTFVNSTQLTAVIIKDDIASSDKVVVSVYEPTVPLSTSNVKDFYIYTFVDVPFNIWYWPYIEGFYSHGITTGCASNPLRYCPDRPVTRAEMAVFVLRAQNGGTYIPNPPQKGVFADVPVISKEWMQLWIEQFYSNGITTGCAANPLRYCPEREVTRAEMAVFILRAIHGSSYSPPSVITPVFTDVPVAGKEWMQPWIEQFYKEGITTGCASNPMRYCPEQKVTRMEMAVFISRAFGFTPVP
jgi:hypothetical protein